MGEIEMTSQVFEWVSPTVTQHVALALLHFLWQGALVAVAVAAMPGFAGEGGSKATAGSPLVRFALQAFFWLWVVGVAVLSLWHIAAWVLSQRFRRHGTTATAEVLDMVRKICRQLEIRRAIAVRQTVEAAAPMVIGWIKPVLVLPMSVLTGLSSAELEAVLAHELAHIRRHD